MPSIKILLIFILIFFFFLLSFKLTDTPLGLTVDESAFGWNAALLSRTGHDQNGKYLPIFVSSINHSDWRQPLTQYYQALFFKLFGISIYNLRLSSVVLTVFSSYLIFYLVSKLLSPVIGLLSSVLLITSPVIFMHSHLGLDNIMPLPLTLLWLIFLFQYTKKHSPYFLLSAGIILGLSFYSYKGMRAIVPVWYTLSLLFLFLKEVKHLSLFLKLKNISPYIFGFIPFMLVIPLIHHYYPGAIFGGARPKVDSIYNLFYAYFSHFDLTFLYIKGDSLLFHSTQFHGMFLLSTLPLFFMGVYQSIRKKGFFLFILLLFFSTPLLYGFVDSVHRASRIIAIVPLYIVISSLGLKYFIKYISNRFLYIIFSFVFLLNFLDFLHYYLYVYPKFTENIFGNMSRSVDYKLFYRQAFITGLTPYVNSDIYEGFFDSIYFSKPLMQLKGDALPPPHSIYLTFHDQLPPLTKINLNLPNFKIFTNP